MIKYARYSDGRIVRDFAGNPFIWKMNEDADGFCRDILGLETMEFEIKYLVHPSFKMNLSDLSSEEIEGLVSAA